MIPMTPEQKAAHKRLISLLPITTSMKDNEYLGPAQCKHCGSEWMARKSDLRRGWAKFCSKFCYSQSRKKGGQSTGTPESKLNITRLGD